MLTVAKNKIGEAATQRVQLARIIVEPLGLLLEIRRDGSSKIGNDEAHPASRPQNTPTFREQAKKFVMIKVLEHVRGVDGIDGVIREWQSVTDVQP